MNAFTGSAGFIPVTIATTIAHTRRTCAYLIEVVRWPLSPVIFFITMLLTYRASGVETANGYDVEGFLLVGSIGIVLWLAIIWSGGYAVEFERGEGTINSLFLTPSSRSGVVLGYSLSALGLFILPSSLIVTLLAVISGARFDIASPLAVLLSLFALVFGALALGHLLAGGFVLTRRANLWANFLQSPIMLLSGMVVPVSELPGWLAWFARLFPISAGMDALRMSLLAGAGMSDIAGPLARLALSSVIALVIGTVLLWRVEDVAKRSGKFDLE